MCNFDFVEISFPMKCSSREYYRGKYHCTIDLLFDWFGISCMTTDNFCYLQNRLIQTCQAGGQWYSDTSPFSIPWFKHYKYLLKIQFWKKSKNLSNYEGMMNFKLHDSSSSSKLISLSLSLPFFSLPFFSHPFSL
jgi:hypothetical protein